MIWWDIGWRWDRERGRGEGEGREKGKRFFSRLSLIDAFVAWERGVIILYLEWYLTFLRWNKYVCI